jgi:hypothetical protein
LVLFFIVFLALMAGKTDQLWPLYRWSRKSKFRTTPQSFRDGVRPLFVDFGTDQQLQARTAGHDA